MERLAMPHPRSHVMITDGARMTSLTAEIEAGEVSIIKYLASCYRRAFEDCKKWKVCWIPCKGFRCLPSQPCFTYLLDPEAVLLTEERRRQGSFLTKI